MNELLLVDRTLEDVKGNQPVHGESREDRVALPAKESCTTYTGAPYLTPALLLLTGKVIDTRHQENPP